MGHMVALMNNNISSVTYVKKWGMVPLSFRLLVRQVQARTEPHLGKLVIRFVPGRKNVTANQLSHHS